jgi:hypothetical protein
MKCCLGVVRNNHFQDKRGIFNKGFRAACYHFIRLESTMSLPSNARSKGAIGDRQKALLGSGRQGKVRLSLVQYTDSRGCHHGRDRSVSVERLSAAE